MNARLFLGVAAGALSAACVISVDGGFDSCRYTAERNATIQTQGMSRVRVIARAGSLDIRGRPGQSEVRVSGTACAYAEGDLDDIELRATESNDEILIEAHIPDRGRLDMVIELPDSMAVDVDDSSGSVEIRDVASVTLHDGSGHIVLERIAGDVTVDDGSGHLAIHEVGGSVIVEDDGSGHIEITQVNQDVVIEEDGSGRIEVTDVRGNFTVRGMDQGSGTRALSSSNQTTVICGLTGLDVHVSF